MLEPALFAINGLLCVVAIACATRVKPGREQAVPLAVLLLANFIFCNLAYTDYAPKHALEALGIEATSKDLWMLADTLLAGAAVTIAYDRWWGWAFGLAGFVQLGIHAAYLANMYVGDFYTDRLSNVLHAQIAVFFLLGGRGVGSLLLSFIAELRSVRRVPQKAFYSDEQET